MRMAVTAPPAALSNFYGDSGSFGQAPGISSVPHSDGPVSVAMAGGGVASTIYSNNYGEMSNLGAAWEFYNNNNNNNNNATSMYNLSPLSESYSTDESDLLLMTSIDSDDFLQCSPITMHPNLVHTLKSLVMPASGSIAVTGHGTMYSAQPGVLDRLEQLNDPTPVVHESRFLRTPLLRQNCQGAPSGVVTKVELPDLSSGVGAVIPTEEPLIKVVEKSETEENIEDAAVVSVDLIKNRRPFRCQHEGCNKTFKNPQTMKMHHKTHYSDGSAGSKGCTLPTLTSNSLKNAGHNKKTPSRCPKCKKTFVGLYELRRHYGRKHSEGEKPFGCTKCGKKFYIEVDVRDHEKLCGKPIECRCGLKFAFKCNLVAHKKAHPACQDHHHGTSHNVPATSSANNGSSCSDDSEQSTSQQQQQQRRGQHVTTARTTTTMTTSGAGACLKRVREESTSPIQSSLHCIPIPDFKGIPEAPEFKLARHESSFGHGGLSFPPETNPLWGSNMVYPTISFTNLPSFCNGSSFQCHHQQQSFKAQPSPLLPFEAVNCEVGIAFNQLPYKPWSG